MQANATSKPRMVVFTEDGEQHSVPEPQAIAMVESIAQKDLQLALNYYLKLTHDNPHAEQLLWKFYETLLNMYMFEELLEVTTARLRKIPSCVISFQWQIDALQHMFRNDDAITLLKQLVKANPDNVASWNSLGSFQRDVGDFDGALSSFNNALKLNPDFAPAHWNRALITNDTEQALSDVRACISGHRVPDQQNHFLHFAAYRLSEKLEQFDEAFDHLQLANTMRRRNLNFDLQQELNIDASAQSIFDRDRLASFAPCMPSEFRPIFIMGMPRSGTTLVEQIIASHPDVSGGDEYTALANATMRAHRQSGSQASIQDWMRTRNTEDWAKLGKLYFENTRFIRKDKKVFTDKNQFNHRSVGLIKASIANAKIIVVDRNPMDVAFGCYRQLFGGNGARFSYQFDEIAKVYRSYQDLMAHWEANTSNFILRINYEDLVKDQQAVTRRMLDFVNLAESDHCYEFHKSQRVVKTLSAAQVRQPIFTHGINRWKRYEKGLQPLLKEMQKEGLVDSASL